MFDSNLSRSPVQPLCSMACNLVSMSCCIFCTIFFVWNLATFQFALAFETLFHIG